MASPRQLNLPAIRVVVVEPGPVVRFWRLFRRAVVAAYEDNCFSIAKGAAFSFLLSVFPVLTALTSVLVQVQANAVVHVIAGFLSDVAPPGTQDIILSRLRDNGAKPISLPIVAILLSLWAGSGAMLSLMEGFQAAYRIPSGRQFLKQRSVAIFLVLTAALPGVGASLLILFGDTIARELVRWLGLLPEGKELTGQVEWLWRIARYIFAYCTTTFVTGLLYYFGPNHRPRIVAHDTLTRRFWQVWPGAFLATGLWFVATAGFAWYVGHRLATYNVFYGSIGAVIVLITWLYLIACIALIGCEFNAERERLALIAGGQANPV
jgi:membrane protein